MNIETVKLLSIKPHPKNMRKHDEANLAAIEMSLRTFGQMKPIVVWKGKVIAGCGTWTAMKRMDWKTCFVVRADSLDADQAIAYCIADNKTSDLSTFNFEKLATEMRQLQEKVDLDITGFRDYEREPLLQAEWKPPAIASGDSSGAGVAVKQLTISFAPEDSDIVMRAIKAVRESDEAWKKESDGAVLAGICQGWIDEEGE